MKALVVEDLVFAYEKDVLAVDHLSFTVHAKNIFGIVGPNGGGKSTAFKIISTLLKPQAGRVLIFDTDAAANPAAARKALGIVFQFPALDKKLTVEENLKYHGLLYGLSGLASKKKIDRLLKRLGLYDRRKEKTEKLSGGLKRRV